jgi:hypothetical protein
MIDHLSSNVCAAAGLAYPAMQDDSATTAKSFESVRIGTPHRVNATRELLFRGTGMGAMLF